MVMLENKLLDFILALDQLPSRITALLKKKFYLIIWCVSKLQNDLFNQKFLIIVDCTSAKEVLQKDVQNLVSKRSFARWQAILSVFDFDIGYIREKIILGNPFMALLYPF